MGLAPASTKMLELYVAGLQLYVGIIFGAQIEKIARTTRNGGVFDNSPDSIFAAEQDGWLLVDLR